MPNRKKVERSANYSYYSDLLWCTVPLIGMSWYYYGARPVLLLLAALLTAYLCDCALAPLHGTGYQSHEPSSECFAALIALLMPASISYPIVISAVIVAVLDHGRLLMTKYANRPLIRRYALIAGFCEIGESFEDTVRREVMEEVGLRVKNLRFYKSQPWVLTDSLLLGFFCDVDGDPTPVLRDGELALAEWHTPEDVPADYSRISLTGEMIDRFREGRIPK